MALIMAHRGASGYAPENTLRAFRKAVAMKADGIECDIHRSKDGVFVVCHDDSIDRTSDGKGKIADLTYEEIASHCFTCRQFFTYYGEPAETAPTLEQMLDVVKDMKIINIEVKLFLGNETQALEDFYAILKRYDVIDRVIVSSFNVELLYRLKQLHGDIATGYLYCPGFRSRYFPSFPDEDVIDVALKYHCDAIHPPVDVLTQEIVDRAHANGLKVNGWMVESRELFEKGMALGCDGFITNFPDWARLALGR